MSSSSAIPLSQVWGVYYHTGAGAVFDVDTVVDLKFGQEAKISTFPVELGSFASYNIVNEPNDPKIRVAVCGQVRIQTLMALLKTLIGTTQLFDVVTPEATYAGVAFIKYDFSRAQKQGKNLLQVDLTFKEIIQVSPAYTKTVIPASKAKNPKSADKGVSGQSQTTPAPTIEQQNGAMSRQLFGGGAVTNSLTGAGVAQ
jgi:hypothetical protein